MQEYIYADFLDTLDDAPRRAAEAIHAHITEHCPDFKPFDIRPTSGEQNVWNLNYRKKPKVGKALCTLYSIDGNLSIRVVGSGFLNYEFVLRQDEFGDKVRNYILTGNGFCKNCGKKCYYEYREYFYVNHEVLSPANFGCEICPPSPDYAWANEYAVLHGIREEDLQDIFLLIDIHFKHIIRPKNPRDIRGGGYAEENMRRLGEVQVLALDPMKLDIDDFVAADYCNAKKIDRYAEDYSLTPMGANDGLWFHHNVRAVCGEAGDDYSYTALPGGRYASVTASDPLSFSVWRMWTYIAAWMRENDVAIRPVDIDGTSVPYFCRFYRENGGEYMAAYVPIE